MALNELPLGHAAEFFFSTVPIDILSGIVVWLPMSSGGQIERDDFMPTDPLPKLTCLEAENCSELIMGDRTKGIRTGEGGSSCLSALETRNFRIFKPVAEKMTDSDPIHLT